MQSSPDLDRDVDGCHGVDGCGGSHHTVDLPPLDAKVLIAVRDLKHYSLRRMVTPSVAEKQENSLAEHICKRWDKFQPSTRSKLKLMKRESEVIMKRLTARQCR